MSPKDAAWIIPFIILGGALQSCGAAMNGELNKHVVNPWLASAISFALITFFFAGASLIHPHPLPTQKDLAENTGGLVGAVQVYAGLTLVNKLGAGPFVGFTVTAALITSLLIDHFGWFKMQPHSLNAGRIIGGVLLAAGISLIAKFLALASLPSLSRTFRSLPRRCARTRRCPAPALAAEPCSN